MVSIKHLVSVFVFEFAALLPIVLVIYWAQNFAGGFKWEAKNALKFNYHPVFMVMAFIFSMGHALVTFRILPIAHRTKKYIHASMNILAAIFAIVGFAAVLQFHNEAGYPNFSSLHSWIGLVALAFLFLQALGGLTIFQDLVKGASDEVRATYKPYHVALGSGMVTLVTAAITTGLQEKYGFSQVASFSSQAYVMNFLAVSVLLWALTVVYILTTLEKRSPESDDDRVPIITRG